MAAGGGAADCEPGRGDGEPRGGGVVNGGMRINFDVLGFIVLFFALILMGVLQVAGATGDDVRAMHQTCAVSGALPVVGAIVVPGMFGYLIMTWLFGGSGQVLMVFFLCIISFPVIWGLYYAKEHVTESLYGQFDFNNFQRVAFNELLTRLAVLFVPLTVVLHMVDYLFVGRHINRHPKLVGFAVCAGGGGDRRGVFFGAAGVDSGGDTHSGECDPAFCDLCGIWRQRGMLY